MDERLDVEARSPGPAGVRVGGDRRVHAASLDADRFDRGGDQIRRTGRELKMRLRLGAHVDAGVLMQEHPVHRRADGARDRVAADDAVMRGGPHGHATPLAPAILKVGHDALPAACSALVRVKACIRGCQGRLPFLEPTKLTACCQDVRREDGHVFERPRQQRCDHGLRNARGLILPSNEAIPGHLRAGPARPGLKGQRGGWKIRAIGVKIEDDFEQERDDHRAASTVVQQLGVTVEKALVDTDEVATAEFAPDEFEETSCAVEYLPEAGGRKWWPNAGKVNVEARIKVFAQAARHRWIRNGAKMHRDVASAGVLAEGGGAEIPAGIAVTGESITAEPGSQRCGRQHRRGVPNASRGQRRNGEAHRRASGGR